MRLVITAHGASRGSVLGRARVRLPHVLDVVEAYVDDVEAELARLHEAVRIVRGEMGDLQGALAAAREAGARHIALGHTLGLA